MWGLATQTSKATQVALLVVVFSALMCFPLVAEEAVGAAELSLLKDIITGNLGHLLALLVTFAGVYSIAKGNAVAGLILIGLAVAFTLLPTVYNGLTNLLCPLAGLVGGACSSTAL